MRVERVGVEVRVDDTRSLVVKHFVLRGSLGLSLDWDGVTGSSPLNGYGYGFGAVRARPFKAAVAWPHLVDRLHWIPCVSAYSEPLTSSTLEISDYCICVIEVVWNEVSVDHDTHLVIALVTAKEES
jgi:hypothetical protein